MTPAPLRFPLLSPDAAPATLNRAGRTPAPLTMTTQPQPTPLAHRLSPSTSPALIAARIRHMLDALWLTRADFCLMTGWSTHTVQEYLHEQRGMGLRRQRQLRDLERIHAGRMRAWDRDMAAARVIAARPRVQLPNLNIVYNYSWTPERRASYRQYDKRTAVRMARIAASKVDAAAAAATAIATNQGEK
jgi:hypothetical protein